MTKLLVRLLMLLNFDRIDERWNSLLAKVKVHRIRAKGVPLCFVPQGGYCFDIAGDLQKFQIDATSHIKSGTFIECSGGVTIGRYFHTGRGLTIFSTNHNYMQPTRIPYDSTEIKMPVVIEDFVWCGVNVTVLPGVTIGEGAVIGAGSVVSRNIPPYAMAAGNPATVLKYRDIEQFQNLKSRSLFE